MLDEKNFPAFPMNLKVTGPNIDPINGDEVPSGNTREHVFPGMMLRDYFAAKAMQTLCVIPVCDWPKSARGNSGSISQMAYEIADAMLAERSKE